MHHKKTRKTHRTAAALAAAVIMLGGGNVFTPFYPSNMISLNAAGASSSDTELGIPYARPTGNPLLRKGSKGEGVSWVQSALNKLGYKLTVDGDFGSGTEKAVKQFQKSCGISVDGIVGKDTINKLVAAIKPVTTTKTPVRTTTTAKPTTTTTKPTTSQKDTELGIPYARPTGDPLLRKGSKGDGVSWVQSALNKLGYKLTVDGDFGSGTEEAVKQFQKSCNIDVDGIVGKDTINKIVYMIKNPVTTTKPPVRTTTTTARTTPTPVKTTTTTPQKDTELGIPYARPTGNPLLRKGSKGDGVSWVQSALNKLGYKLTVDGDFGSGTEEAVKQFQKSCGLSVDGIVGKDTINKIVYMIKNPVTTTKPPVRTTTTTARTTPTPVKTTTTTPQKDTELGIPYARPTGDPLLRKGSKGDGVSWVQSALNKLGYKLTVDGDFGSGTEEAVKQFQKSCNISDDGIVGKDTISKIVYMIKNPVTTTKPPVRTTTTTARPTITTTIAMPNPSSKLEDFERYCLAYWTAPITASFGEIKKDNGRAFGCTRSGRTHAAIDYVCAEGTEVYAMTDGTVADIYGFYEGTDAVEVNNVDGSVARYCEISPAVSKGSTVKKGQVIGTVIANNSPEKSHMLHLELYKGTETGPLTQTGSRDYDFVDNSGHYQRRKDLLDPTFLLNLSQSSSVTPTPSQKDTELGIPYARPTGNPLLKKGSKGDGVSWVQSALNKLGYKLTVDGDFGSGTEEAVKQFQKSCGISDDGIVGKDTINNIVNRITPVTTTKTPVRTTTTTARTTPTPVRTTTTTVKPNSSQKDTELGIPYARPTGNPLLKNGSSGEGVSWVQSALNKLGFNLSVDGKFGSGTEAAVKRFQSFCSISDDGIVGSETINYLVKHVKQGTVVIKPVTIPSGVSENGIAFIKGFEGFVKYAEWDQSQYSIGYGTGVNKDDYPNGITVQQADALLRSTLNNTYVPSLRTFCINNGISLNQAQFDALIDFSYNLGPYCWTASTGFETIQALLKSGNNNASDIRNTFGLYNKVDSKENAYQTRRRAAEADLYITGEYNNPDIATPTPSQPDTKLGIPYARPTGNPLLKNGSSGEGVSWVQSALNKRGYKLTVDGIFGKDTEQAVKQFQKSCGISVDGIVGKDTINMLVAKITPDPTPTTTAKPTTTTTTSTTTTAKPTTTTTTSTTTTAKPTTTTTTSTTTTAKPTTTTTTSTTTTAKPTTSTTTTAKPTTTTTTSTTTTAKPTTTTTTTTSTTTTAKPTTTTTSTTTTAKPTTTTTTSTTTTAKPTTTTTTSTTTTAKPTTTTTSTTTTAKPTTTTTTSVTTTAQPTTTTTTKPVVTTTIAPVTTTTAVVTTSPTTTIVAQPSFGDPNGDHKINAVDATDVLKIYIKIAVDKIEITTEELAYCDVNNDGAVNAVDASYILSYYAYTSTNSSEAKMSFEEYMKNN